jgi:hypothetical protein
MDVSYVAIKMRSGGRILAEELETSAASMAHIFRLPVRRGGWAELGELEKRWLADFFGLLVVARRAAAYLGAVQLLDPPAPR